MKILFNTAILPSILEFIIINTLYFIFNKDKTKRTKYILIQIAIFIAVIVFPALQVEKAWQLTLFYMMQTLYEIIIWGMMIYTIIKSVRKKDVKLRLSKQEKILAIISFVVEMIVIITMALTNYKYILPFNKYGNIENVYFNADLHRGVFTFTNYENIVPVENIHPLCRFILLPIYIPIILVEFILGLNSELVGSQYIMGYFVIVIQCLMNTISVLCLYRILKKLNVNKKIRILACILFIFSFAFTWLTIFPETYSMMLCLLLITVYNYLNKNKIWYITAIMTIGTNVVTLAPIGIMVLWEIIKVIKKSSKKYLWITLISVASIVFIILFYKMSAMYVKLWMDSNITNICERLYDSINKFIIPICMWPNYIQNGVYFVEIKQINILAVILFIILSIIAVLGYIINRKKFTANLCIIELLTGFGLHIVLGYGLNTGAIYASLYVWAFIILIALGMEYIVEKKEKLWIIFICLTIITVGYNVWNINQFRTQLSTINFEEPQYIEQPNTYFLKYSDGTGEQLVKDNFGMILMSTGERILSRIDADPIYNEDENYIVGNLKDRGLWFKIYIENDKLKVNICENIKEINTTKFYIFGMGMREKAIFKCNSETNKYDLIKYTTKEEILNDLELDNIDYENYEIVAKSGNETIKIWENEDGIFYEKNHETKTIDNSTKINIPTFEGYEHKAQLRILFNEVMVNVLPNNGGVTPNFITYPTPWYRDGAISAMVLEKTNNIPQIEKWIENLNSIYDYQNGENEPDNLGEILYLQSLVKNKNEKLINDVLEEAEKITNESGYIEGKTDGSEHPVYQTAWLIYGLKSLKLDYSKWKIPDITDTYKSLTWFEKSDDNEKQNDEKIMDSYQYLKYARLHYYEIPISENIPVTYQISYEQNGSKAQYQNIEIINENYKNNRLSVPHIWSSAEMFLYYLDLDEGK